MEERFRLTRRRFLFTTGAFFVTEACGPLGASEPSPKRRPEIPGISDLSFPLSSDMYLLLGPHYKKLSEGVRYAIDVTSLEKDVKVIAAKGGTVVLANDYMVEIGVGDGYTVEYVHVDNIKVKVGDKVDRYAELGDMTMKSPQGGSSDVLHLHFGIKRYGQPVPIDGKKLGDRTIHEGKNPGEGTMTGENYTVVANTNLCGPMSTLPECVGRPNLIINRNYIPDVRR